MPERRTESSPEPTSHSVTTAVEAIVEKTAKNGRKFQAIEYVAPSGELKNVAVWDKKLLDGLEKGHAVELTFTRKGSYWNLTSLTRLGTAALEEPTVDAPKTTERTSSSLTPPIFHPTIDAREYAMRSMNALTNAVVLVSALIAKDVLKPTDAPDAFTMVQVYHTQMMALHQQQSSPHKP